MQKDATRQIWYNGGMDNNDMTNWHRTRGDWQAYVAAMNERLENDAIKQFESSDEAKRMANADAVIAMIADAVCALRGGRAPDQFPRFLAGELSGVLSTKTWADALRYEVREELPDSAFDTENLDAVASPEWTEVWTDAFHFFHQIAEAFAAFLREAALFAKKKGCVDAARNYLLAWRGVNRIENNVYFHLSQKDAEETLGYTLKANDILWADLALESLEEQETEV